MPTQTNVSGISDTAQHTAAYVRRIVWTCDEGLLSCLHVVRSASDHEVIITSSEQDVWVGRFSTENAALAEASRLQHLFCE